MAALLGEGGMGQVYRATGTKLQPDVELKILLSAVATDPGRLARFSREAQVLASLNHPHTDLLARAQASPQAIEPLTR